jgi:hypothetical protein
MKTNAFYKLFLLAVISSSLSTHLDAQGNIFRRDQLAKRRADIASGTIARNLKKVNGIMFSDSGVVSGFVMRKTGQLQVYYAYANRLDRELPANAALITHFVKGDSSRSDSLLPRFPNRTGWWRAIMNWCLGYTDYRYEYDYTNVGSPEEVYLYNVGHVTQGDSVQFFYVSDDIQTGDSVLYGIYSADTAGTGWNVIFGNVDYCIYDYTDVLNVYIGVNDAPEIMLGETKYYYATEADSKLTIHETTSHELPSEAVHSDVWGETPVTAVTDKDNSGRKLGVYWEKKYPVYTGNEFTGMENLPAGMIRLVGRYWHADSLYTVKLTTGNYNPQKDLVIEVKKPSTLGNDYGPNSDGSRRTTVSDVFSHPYNLDSIIINYAGKYGIPPQILKADMQQESNFQPAYRWEPFVDVVYIQNGVSKYMDDDFRYKKTATSEGQPGIPTNHTNVYPIPYPTNDYKTIWERFFEQSWDLNGGTGTNRYPKRTWYTDPSDEWQLKYNKKAHELSVYQLTEDEVDIAAREYANEWLRDEYREGVMSEGIAQTRTAASYGLMQMLYMTAVDRHYPFERTSDPPVPAPCHLPEYINITDTNLAYAVPFLLAKIKDELITQGDGSGKAYNWSYGFESTILVGLNLYNGKKKDDPERYSWHYGFEVFDKVYQYVPMK